jgi:membrane-associated phospholipid phosphatase
MNGEIIELLPADSAAFLSETFLGKMYLWGIALIKTIQQIESPALMAVLKVVTALGTEALYVPLILCVFWWIDEKRGLRFGMLIIISAWLNSVVKDLLKQPRPFNIEPALGKAFEPTYGAPSGHSQNSMIFWIPVAAWFQTVWKEKRILIWTLAVSFVLLIGFTRLYLGVHFPTDLLAGWLLAGIILVLYFTAGPFIEKFFTAAGTRAQNIAAAAAVFAMNGLYPKDRTLPALLLGFFIGYTVMKQRFPFSARGTINGKKPSEKVMFLRALTGLLGIGIIYFGLRLIFPGEGSLFAGIPQWGAASAFYETGRFIRYSLIGFWASAGAPRMFQLMGLAQVPVEESK